jgi:PKD repeat protein
MMRYLRHPRLSISAIVFMTSILCAASVMHSARAIPPGDPSVTGSSSALESIITASPQTDPPLAISISANPPSGLVPLKVNFASSVGAGTSSYSYHWEFGDGSSSEAGTVTHIFDRPGTFNSSLKVTDSAGDAGTSSVAIKVANQIRFSVSIIPSLPSGPVPLGEGFSTSVTGGTPPFSYSWDFGDGTTGTGGTTNHVYTKQGTYRVNLAVATSTGDITTQSTTIYVTAAVPLSVSMLASSRSAQPGSTIQFTTSTTGGPAPYSYSWDFGDGSSATGGTVSHTFGTSGVFSVVLTVQDATGRTATETQSITISSAPPLTVNLAVNYPSGTAPLGVRFTGTISGGTPGYQSDSWNYGDGGTAQTGSCGSSGCQVAADRTYSNPGNYTVTLTVKDSAGNTFTASIIVHIVAPPLAVSLAVNYPSGTAPLGVRFTGTISGGTPGYQSDSWNYGDGGTAQTGSCGSSGCQVAADRTYSNPGNYTVSLTVTDSSGASVTAATYVIATLPTVTTTVSTSTVTVPVTATTTATSTVFSGVTSTVTSTGTQFVTVSGTTTVTSTGTQFVTVSGTTTVTLQGSDSLSYISNQNSIAVLGGFAIGFTVLAFVWRKRP